MDATHSLGGWRFRACHKKIGSVSAACSLPNLSLASLFALGVGDAESHDRRDHGGDADVELRASAKRS
jgi:hypothetical protein